MAMDFIANDYVCTHLRYTKHVHSSLAMQNSRSGYRIAAGVSVPALFMGMSQQSPPVLCSQTLR